MTPQEQPPEKDYPHGRGYGHDYMRGGEVGEGYGYAAREEYSKPRGDDRGKRGADADPAEGGEGSTG